MYPPTIAGAKAIMGPPLPTIKSENSASPGVSTPATTVKVDEGVALPAELVDVKEPVSSPAGVPISNGKSSPDKTDKE
jgi:hypothetical protein